MARRDQPRLFALPPRERKTRRVLMHVIDAGPDTQFEDGAGVVDRVRFRCNRCRHETGWLSRRRSDARRGEPCPRCNPERPHT